MSFFTPIRWGDNDRYFGPFTFARESDGYRTVAVMLGSGDGDDYAGCRLRISAFGRTMIIALPPIVKPWRQRVVPGWDAETIARLNRDFYWSMDEREFGFTCSEGYLSIRYGRQSHDSSTERSWGYFLPWMQWRHVRRSFYGILGQKVGEITRQLLPGQTIEDRRAIMDAEDAIAEACPTVCFAFLDFDGEGLTATTRIEEREWRRGTGWFRWLSLFCRPKIVRSLDIRFSGETGKRKVSWKGGTIGHSIDMLPGELHHAAFLRYCAQNRMKFVGSALPNEVRA